MLFVSTTLPSGQASGCVMLPQGSKQPLLISQREGDGLSPGTSDGAAVERSCALLGGVSMVDAKCTLPVVAKCIANKSTPSGFRTGC